MARQYATIVGIVVFLVGIVGLFADSILGVFNSDILEDIIHLATGGLMAYVGLVMRGNAMAKTVVGGLGVVYLIVGVLGFIAPQMFGLFPSSLSAADNILHLALGVLGILVGYFVGGERRATA